MTVPVVQELWLKQFKSYRGARLPLDDLTVLTGRNGSGKSNALDALEVLTRMATGEELADALDGRRREGGPVRGGSRGCAPHGTSAFSLGCDVRADSDRYVFYIEVQVEPELRIVHEELFGPAPAVKSRRSAHGMLVWTPPSSAESASIRAEIHNGKQGVNPQFTFRDARMLLSQVPLRISPSTVAEEAVVRGAETVTSALRGVFHLDPVPHLMRGYVAERDDELRRTAENLSATIGRLARDNPAVFSRLRELVERVADHSISGVDVTRSALGDVMLTLEEADGGITSARELSDGLLRFIAIATALLTTDEDLDVDHGVTTRQRQAGVLLVVEELENGLHPSQADLLLRLIRSATSDGGRRALVTTHSPALLNAMTGELNNSILVCYRDARSGVSDIARMPNLPGYAEAIASGPIGDAVSGGSLTRPREKSPDHDEFNRLLGIDLPA